MKKLLQKYGRTAYWAMFLSMLIYRFLNTTLFFEDIDIFYAEGGIASSICMWLFLKPYGIIVVIVLLLYLTKEKPDWKQIGILFFYDMILIYCSQKTDCDSLLTYLLLLPGAAKVDFEKLIKADVWVSTILTVVTIVCSLTGVLDNLTWGLSNGQVRMAFGFVYSTDFAAHIFFLMLGWWYLRREKANWKDSIFWLVIGAVVFKFSIARNSSALIAMTALLMAYCGKIKKTDVLEKKMLPAAPLICAAAVSGLSVFYNPDIAWTKQLDSWFSNRLMLVKKAINFYGFQLWGAPIPMTGNGSKTSSSATYFYIDSGYMQIGLLYGVVLLAIVLCLLTWICQKAAEQDQRILLWIVALACVHGMIEQHLFELEYFPFFLAAFANLKEKGQRELLHGKEK
ncbi:hypothetical protein [Hominiventricola filiformis]|uniref:Polymerase n=1 Tax=Hominiventricola filiformis TaxID=2885352 RepID=A0AAE3A903_9FIRM|nr:hypothetical protein [Hominiventricola filiformis]MCC2125370.1 hypothetical protein [Hominiventricola filiformis]